ncbi:MAG: replicative DNA helicase, partial [Butyrivibrio sp.]|nr:replicative DNA helicase [Butyrivibrio sp.]
MPEENLLKRVAPNSIEAEKSVVGAMIMDNEAIQIAAEIVTADDFYNKQLGTLFETMVELDRSGSAVDMVTLQNRLREKNVSPQISSNEFIAELVDSVPTSANIKYYAQIVAEKSTLRKLIHVSEDTINTCYTDADDMEGILNDVEKNIFQITQKRNTGDFVPIDKVVMNALDRIEMASKMKGNVTGNATGYIDLDYNTAGFQPSDLILIAARPAMGKTAFVLNIAEYMAF